MHQPVSINIDPLDTDPQAEFVRKPFFIWLASMGNDAPGNYIDAIVQYFLGTGYTRSMACNILAGEFNADDVDAFKYTHEHYWWLNHRGHQIAQLVLEAASQTNEELAA